MPSAKIARGRPKGTGLDDRAVLQSMSAMIEANPNLKPTTAIKSIGISNPSAIRRLRDKFNVTQARAAQPAAVAPRLSQERAPARSMALKSATDAVRTSAPKQSSSPQLPPTQLAGSDADPIRPEPGRAVQTLAFAAPEYRQHSLNWFSMWTELGLQSMAASISAQWMIYDHVLRSPPVRAALSGQSALTDFAAAWCATSPDPGKTLH